MLDGFFEKIINSLKELCSDIVIGNLNALAIDMNEKTGQIAEEVSKGPSTWNSSVFGIIESLSKNVILPLGGLILTYVVVYELYYIAVEQNSMKEFDIRDMYKFLFKACLSVFLLSNCFEIVMAIFDVGTHIVSQALSSLQDSDLNLGDFEHLRNSLMEEDLGALILMMVESLLIRYMIMIIAIVVTVIVFGRMIEIYLYVSVAPIPFATLGNKDLSSVGQNYIKSLVAVAFQGFFILVCVAIYSAMVSSVTAGAEIHETLMTVAISSLVLLFVLLKSGSVSKSIFGAH